MQRFISGLILSASIGFSLHTIAAPCSSNITVQCVASGCSSAHFTSIGPGDWKIPQGCKFNILTQDVSLQKGEKKVVGTYSCENAEASTGPGKDPLLKVTADYIDIDGKAYKNQTSSNTIYCGKPACGIISALGSNLNPPKKINFSAAWGGGCGN